MPFHPHRYADAVTISWLIDERMGMVVHCNKCARHVVLDPATLHLAPEARLCCLSPAGSRVVLDTGAKRWFGTVKSRDSQDCKYHT